MDAKISKRSTSSSGVGKLVYIFVVVHCKGTTHYVTGL